MRIEIVSIGNEVLEGQTINTNASWIACHLTEKGYEIARQTVLPDDSTVLFEGLKESLSRSTLVVATGGLGPTMDDLTKQIASRLFRSSLHIDSALYDDLRARYGDLAHLENQAKVPQNAIVLKNRIGTAPGFLFLSTEGSLLLLPGEPHEMKQMFTYEALPLILEHFLFSPKRQTVSISLCLLSEMQVDPILRDIQHDHPDAKMGLYPSLGSLLIRLSVTHHYERLEQWEAKIRAAFPTHYFAPSTLHEAVHHALISHQKTLSLAESCTGGALSSRLVSMAGASQYLLGSLVVYSNGWKEQFLGVSHQTLEREGAVSAETVKEMVQGLLHRTKADYGCAISGIAGPGGSSAQKPVGTVFIGIGEKNKEIDIGKIAAPPDRISTIDCAVQYALAALYRRITYQTLTFHEL